MTTKQKEIKPEFLLKLNQSQFSGNSKIRELEAQKERYIEKIASLELQIAREINRADIKNKSGLHYDRPGRPKKKDQLMPNLWRTNKLYDN
ncbi:MAG: hypothetical protein R6V14_04050 [Halanaerobiales bacterium]